MNFSNSAQLSGMDMQKTKHFRSVCCSPKVTLIYSFQIM